MSDEPRIQMHFEPGSNNTIVYGGTVINGGTFNAPVYTSPQKEEETKKPEGVLSDDDLREKINHVLDFVQTKRMWFCILKVLMLRGQLLDGDFDGGKRLLERLYPAGVKLGVDAKDLAKLNVDSFRLPYQHWNNTDAPVTRQNDFLQYQSLAKKFDELF